MPTEVARRLKLRGPMSGFWQCYDREQLLEGPAGTGKTTAALARILSLGEDHGGLRVLMTRKKRVDMSESILKTWEEDVLPPDHECRDGPERSHRRTYDFGNGSRVVTKGLDDPNATRSAEYDLIYIGEASEITEDDYEMLHRCLRSYRMPHQMIWADTNPAHPDHWLNRRANAGKMRRWITRHHHNPMYWDDGDWTEKGRDYVLGTLANLTGIRRKRLYEGKWCGSEGIVYDRWDRNVHVGARSQDGTRRIVAVDEGYTNPFAALDVLVDGDARLHISREVYRRQLTIAQKVEAVKGLGPCEAVLVDPSAADLIRELRDAGLPAIPAQNEVFDGIVKVQGRLELAGDGRPRLTVDPSCENLIREFETYEWRSNKQTGGMKDEPVKEHDHALDALRYAVAYLDRGPASVAVGAPKRVDADMPTQGNFAAFARRPVSEQPYGSPHRPWNRAQRPRY